MRTWPACFILCLWGIVAPAFAQPAVDPQKPVYMDADRLGYDQKNALVVALGNVRVVQGDSTLFADRITYFQTHNIVRADGNVRVEDRIKNETYYADEVQLKDDLMQGVIHNFRVRLADNSQFAAREARRLSDTQTELKKAVYSPCDICEGKDPFWQLKAEQVEIDETAQKVYYDDVYLEFYGVPVAYTPYFSHPTPDADAKSGFLIPEYSQSSNLGTTVKAPYYISIAPDKEAIITPYLTSEDGPVLIGEYNQLFDSGFLEIESSFTYPKTRDDSGTKLSDREVRGHIYARGESAVSANWRAGFDIKRTTDDTYLRRYRFGSPRSLTSRIYSEGLYGRSYAILEGLTFQGLDINDDPDREPYVLPLARGYYESDAGLWGVQGLRSFNSGNVQLIAREEGRQSRRLSIDNGLKLPMASSGGHLFDATASTRLDVYSVENLQLPGGEYDGEEVRVIPTASLKWRYPLIRHFDDGSLTIEPTVLAVARPGGGNPNTIPNEDNQIVEFSDANIFEVDPFPGYDTIDEGSRVAYGLSGHWWMGGRSNLHFMAGQNASLEADTPFPYNDEDGEHFSDYVGRVAFDYDPFALSYRLRLDQDSLAFNNQSVGLGVNYQPLRLQIDYVTFEDDAYLDDREELLLSMALALSDEWSVRASGRRDLMLGDMLYAGGGLTYQNECFTLDTAFSRSFTRDRDIEPDNSVSLRVSFKNLTEL